MKIYNYLLNIIQNKGAAFLLLIDPDHLRDEDVNEFVRYSENSGVDGFLVGGSLMFHNDFSGYIKRIKQATKLPVIIFPGNESQVSKDADALLFISVISGRNADHIIGKQVASAPHIKATGIEPISTGYIIVESGRITTAEYMNGSLPIPRNKPEIACATALAAEYIGMKFIYLEAGSGADYSVPNEMIEAVSNYTSLPLIVGGGISTSNEAHAKVKSGAKIIVTGNFFENKNNKHLIKEFAEAIHIKTTIEV